MLTVASRAKLNDITGEKPAAPLPAPAPPVAELAAPPPAPAGLSPSVERALAMMADRIALAADIAAAAQESVAQLADRRNISLEADIVRDHQGKMQKIIITTRK